MREHDAQRIIICKSSQVPLVSVSFANLHFRSRFEHIIFERLAGTDDAIYFELLGDSDSELAGEWKVEQSNFVRLIKLLETLLEDKVIKLFMHRQQTSTLIHHILHF